MAERSLKYIGLKNEYINFLEELEEESIKIIGKQVFWFDWKKIHGTFKLLVYLNALQLFQIEIIKKYFKDQFIITNGILKEKGFTIIKIR